MFSVGIKGNHVRSHDRGDRPNHVTKLAVGMQVMFTKADVTRKPRGVTHQDRVTRKPGLARGPIAYILRLSIPLLDKTRIDYQT
jgi:hypothetical protein